MRWFSYPWETEIGVSSSNNSTTTSHDVIEAKAETATITAVLDPSRYRACLLQNNFELPGKTDEKGPRSSSLEPLQASHGHDKDVILEVSHEYLGNCNFIDGYFTLTCIILPEINFGRFEEL